MYLDLIKGYRVTIGGTMPLLKNIERTLHTRTQYTHANTHTYRWRDGALDKGGGRQFMR